jgi:NADH-quinone oxidoreductase subunit N
VTEAIQHIQTTASLLVPEILLLAAVCVLFLAGALVTGHTGDAPAGLRHQWGFVALTALGVAWALWLGGGREGGQGALFRIDELVWYTRGVTLSAGILLTLMLWDQIDDRWSAEAHACLLAIIAGVNLVAAADDLVSLFLALELVSIPTYVLLYLPSRVQSGREAAVKYFLLSVFSSALVLYGMSWLYGAAGSTNFAAIAAALDSVSPESAARLPQIGLAFLVAGLSFRIAAVPFHFYAPDVFQGTTASNAALLSVIPKVVGFVALIRLVPLTGVTPPPPTWLPEESTRLLFTVLAAVTMFVGNLMALRQGDLYRLMAYSSIAHAGYMLIGLSVAESGDVEGIDAILFYLVVYGLMTAGVFALLGAVGERLLRTAADLRGLNGQHPAVALLLAVCLFSLTGLPPTAGFWGKLNLFFAAWADATGPGRSLAVILAVNAAISAWYYLRLVALMFLEPSDAEARPGGIVWSSWIAGVICSMGTIALFIAPQWLWDNLP